MPALSMFFGLIVYMYAKDNQRHHIPQIHVEYQDDEAVFSIPDGEILEGKLPNKKNSTCISVDNNPSGRPHGKLEFGGERKYFIQNQTFNVNESKSSRC
jgi:hypothetical protein